MENNCDLTIEALSTLIRRKKLSPVELTRFLLDRIYRLQPAINAYITLTAEIAIAQAGKAEKEIAKGRYRGMLHGIPISLKDLFYTRGVRTTAGSRVLSRFYPKENATIVNRLLERGCVMLGKANMHEFAYGPTSVHSHYGPVRNPWDPNRISGGSSGGSAASVVSAQAIASFGTDTGGSIRIPSAACGCVGLKPTYGRVPLRGVIPLAGSLDHAGPLSRCVMDAAILLEAVSDSVSGDPGPDKVVAEIHKRMKSFRIGVPRQYFFDSLHPDVLKTVLASVSAFKQVGASVRELDLEGMAETTSIAAEITGDEAFAYHEKWLKEKSKYYGHDVRSRLKQSCRATATDYIHAQQNRIAYTERLEKALAAVDVLLAPTIPVTVPQINQNDVRTGGGTEDTRQALLRLTRPANLSGLPAISIPCGFSPDGLPVGLQLIGHRNQDITLLRIAYAYEQVTPWHRHFPPDLIPF